MVRWAFPLWVVTRSKTWYQLSNVSSYVLFYFVVRDHRSWPHQPRHVKYVERLGLDFEKGAGISQVTGNERHWLSQPRLNYKTTSFTWLGDFNFFTKDRSVLANISESPTLRKIHRPCECLKNWLKIWLFFFTFLGKSWHFKTFIFLLFCFVCI